MHQPVHRVHARVKNGAVHVRLGSRTAVDLELWDAAREAPLFRQILGKRLVLAAARG